MRLIDADALMKVYAPYEFMADMGDAMEILANFPTVDAVPVIRCKDCKFHHDRTQCNKRIGAWFDDDYCNGAVRAERKEE